MTSQGMAAAGVPLPPAPGAERYSALDLANTLQGTPAGTTDLIGDRESATGWLLRHGLLPEDAVLGDPCTARLRTLRHDVRALLDGVTREVRPPQRAVDAVNAALGAVATAEPLVWEPGSGLRRRAAHPLDRLTDHALALLAADAAALVAGPDADKLAACGAGHCTRFLLRTHASRQWCSVRCGDRVRAARAYARRNGA